MRPLRIGVLTCSDTRAAQKAEDTAGKALVAACEERGWVVAQYCVVPDDAEEIAMALMEMCDLDAVDILLTCGGTGLGPRDVTPEVTIEHSERLVPGIAEAIRAASMKITGRAMLSRSAAAMRGRTLIINLPGSEKAAMECFGFVVEQLEHAVDMMAGEGHG